MLFNFPSRYLFSIGIVLIFSIWRDISPTLSCTYKQLDSKDTAERTPLSLSRDSHPLWCCVPANFTRKTALHNMYPIPYTAKNLASELCSSLFTRRYSRNHCYFLFLLLLICLSSEGNPAPIRSLNSYVLKCIRNSMFLTYFVC